MGFFVCGEGVGCGDGAGLLKAVNGCVEPGVDEDSRGLGYLARSLAGIVEKDMAEAGLEEAEWGLTFFWSWKPTCPVAIPAFLWRFDQGV